MPVNHPFDSILEAARNGGEWAWTRIVSDIGPTLSAYARRQGALDVDEVVSETWMHIARGIGRFEGDEQHFRSWVFMVAHHRIVDERRRLSRRAIVSAEDGVLTASSPLVPSAEMAVMERSEHEALQETLDKLPASQREVIVLRFIADFGVTEIAHIVGKKPGAVSALLRRGLKRLEKILGERRTFSS